MIEEGAERESQAYPRAALQDSTDGQHRHVAVRCSADRDTGNAGTASTDSNQERNTMSSITNPLSGAAFALGVIGALLLLSPRAEAATISITGTSAGDTIENIGFYYSGGVLTYTYCLGGTWTNAGAFSASDNVTVYGQQGADTIWWKVDAASNETCGGSTRYIIPAGGANCPASISAYLYLSYAETDDDTYYASLCGDYASGGYGDDLIVGGSGIDALYGGNGDDRVWGGGGDDTVSGGSDNDQVSGDDGNDDVVGGSGSDSLYGGSGNDCLDDQSGVVTCSCGTGTDAENCIGTDGTSCESHTTCL